MCNPLGGQKRASDLLSWNYKEAVIHQTRMLEAYLVSSGRTGNTFICWLTSLTHELHIEFKGNLGYVKPCLKKYTNQQNLQNRNVSSPGMLLQGTLQQFLGLWCSQREDLDPREEWAVLSRTQKRIRAVVHQFKSTLTHTHHLRTTDHKELHQDQAVVATCL